MKPQSLRRDPNGDVFGSEHLGSSLSETRTGSGYKQTADTPD
jgi:hypothetical protein